MNPADPLVLPTVRTPRLIVRPLQADDRDAYIEMFRASAEHLRKWSPARRDDESLEAFWDRQWQRAQDGLRTGAALRLVGIHAQRGDIAGCYNLNNITRNVFMNADAGWHTSVQYVKQGLGAEGVGALVDLAFAPQPHGLGLHRVQANVIPENTASLRLAARCGFRVEGLARRMLLINGLWQDHVMHAKLAEEHTPGSPPIHPVPNA